MAGRSALGVGSHGTIWVRPHSRNDAGEPTSWRAITYYRDSDGIRRRVSKVASSKTAATRGLNEILRDRGSRGGEFTSDTRVSEAAASWLAGIQRQVDCGDLSPGTLRLYRMAWDNHLKPRLGALRLREATVTRCNDSLVAITDQVGSATAKTARAALSGVMGHAVRHGGLDANPVRECARIRSRPTKAPRAMTEAERDDWLTKMERDRVAASQDIPDLTRLLLATGVRIAELLAVDFDDVDFAARTVNIDWQITRVKGTGLVRRETKTKFGERTLRLPEWAMSVLRRRKLLYGQGPVFPHARMRRNPECAARGEGWRDPNNTSRDFRHARGRAGFDWVTTHVFRKTVATVLDEAGLTGREIADHLGHSRVSMTQDVYMGRGVASDGAAVALEAINPDRPR